MGDIFLEVLNNLKDHAYLVTLISLCFEFMPSELVLPLVGSWIKEKDLNIHLLALLGAAGGTIGPITLFELARWKGRGAVLKYGKWFLIKAKHIEAADNFFGKYGGAVAFFARFMPIVRTAISVPCGLSKMKLSTFSVYTFLATYPVTYLYLLLGKKLGENWEEASGIFSKYSQWFAAIFIIFVIIIIFFKKRVSKKDYKKAKLL